MITQRTSVGMKSNVSTSSSSKGSGGVRTTCSSHKYYKKRTRKISTNNKKAVVNDNNTNDTNNTNNEEKQRQEKIKSYWRDRRKQSCNENDPMCLDILRKPMKSFDELEEEERLMHEQHPEFIDSIEEQGGVKLGIVNDIQSFPIFKGEVLNAPEDSLNVVEFTASWCRPCKKFASKYTMFAEYYSRVRFFKVQFDSDPVLAHTAKSMNVTATPAFFFFRGSKMIGSFSGTSEDNFRDELNFACTANEKP